MDASASARDRHLPELDMNELLTRCHLDRELRALSGALRREMVTKKDLRDLERRLTEHIDLCVDARLAANMRSTLAWLAVTNATMLAAVIAALRL